MSNYISVDLGAGSGRLVRGSLENGRLSLSEIARFPNETVCIRGRLYWNIAGLFAEIRKALCSVPKSPRHESIGVDTWGVDFVLLDKNGEPAGMPVAYRDSRTDGLMRRFFDRVPKDLIYQKTGIQFMQINTIYQLFALSQADSPQLKIARDLLFIPDYLNFLFTGEKFSESTISSTSQLLNILDGDWDGDLIKAAGIERSLFQKIVAPGAKLGTLAADIANESSLGALTVIASASHDTAAAVAAIPAAGYNWAYISSGTWSLMGIEAREPILTREALDANFTNEGGVGGTIRFLKNIMGLWPIQRIHVETGGKHGFAELASMAREAKPFKALINVDDPRFHNPGSMCDAITGYCRETGQQAPDTLGELVRCSLESLALQYRFVLGELTKITGKRIEKIHVVGGGSKNALLNRMTADATGLPVYAGPAEATSLGNIIVQAVALGHIASIEDGRAIISASEDILEYQPGATADWDTAMEKYSALRNH